MSELSAIRDGWLKTSARKLCDELGVPQDLARELYLLGACEVGAMLLKGADPEDVIDECELIIREFAPARLSE